MRAKKAAARRPSLPPSDDPFFIRPVPSPTLVSPPFSASAFDQHMGLQSPTAEVGRVKEAGVGGLGKKLLSFPWTRSDKKHAALRQQSIIVEATQPLASTSSASPDIVALRTTSSLPLGFPSPVSRGNPADALQCARQHPSFAATHTHVPGHPQSNASLSTINTTSSSASTSLFYSSEDGGWQSEATSLASSPERGDNCAAGNLRMWRVKPLAAEGASTLPDIAERENEDARLSVYDGVVSATGRSTPVRRNSTPVPSAVAAMLSHPETPPRPKRYSASDATLSPLSHDKATATPCAPGSPGSEADDEVSPPRGRRPLRRALSQDLLLESPSKSDKRFSPSHRIPSIRFEGISMDAFFAEVEAKVNLELAAGGPPTPSLKQARRRTRVLSTYLPYISSPEQQAAPLITIDEPEVAPVSLEQATAPAIPEPPAKLPSSPQLPLDVPRPRLHPRRSSSRPAPLNVAAANALPAWSPRSAPLQASTSMWSPAADGSSSRSPAITATLALASPPLAGSFPSPVSSGAGTLSPGLAAPFDPAPSPALSSTSTFKQSDIPELLVCPPSPPPAGQEPKHAPVRPPPRRQSLQSAPPPRRPHSANMAVSPTPPTRRPPPRPLTIINGATKVTVVPDKKVVRVSTRVQASKRKTYVAPPRAMSSPPSPPQVEVTPPPPPSVPLFADELFPTPPASPTVPYILPTPYNPPSVLRTDFHPALSNLAVPPSPQRSHHDSDSSDCEESLHNMLMRLNRPHTPPTPAPVSAAESGRASPSESTTSLSLTELALELHNTSHARLSMLAREMGAVVVVPQAAKENAPIARARSASACSRRHERRYSKLYNGVDVPFVAPAPLTLCAPKPFSPRVTHPQLVAASEHAPAESRLWDSQPDVPASPATGAEGDDDEQTRVDIESEIDRTLATLVGEQAEASSHASTFSPASSTSSAFAPRRRGHAQTDSASSLDYLAEAAAAGEGEGMARSDSLGSQLTASSFDDDDNDLDVGVVCHGERVSCMYNVGVIGMAM
ncbi:hypothetical protein JCM3770_005232 [Rhodotorula araucariae]